MSGAGGGHRPGPLKQQNKTHKHGKHRSKGETEKAFKGKVGAKTLSKKNKAAVSKSERRRLAEATRKGEIGEERE